MAKFTNSSFSFAGSHTTNSDFTSMEYILQILKLTEPIAYRLERIGERAPMR